MALQGHGRTSHAIIDRMFSNLESMQMQHTWLNEDILKGVAAMAFAGMSADISWESMYSLTV